MDELEFAKLLAQVPPEQMLEVLLELLRIHDVATSPEPVVDGVLPVR